MQKATDRCFPIPWASRVSRPCSATPQLPRISEKQQLLLGSWPRSQPTPTLHPSHSFTGWSHFHNKSLDTFPALSTALPKLLETICHLLHQHTAIALSPQHINLLCQLLLPALPPTTLGRTTHLEQLLSTASQEKQEGRAISPSVCLFVIEEQPHLTGPGSFTSSSRPPAWFLLQAEQVMGTRPRRAAALPCCRAEYTFTQAQSDPEAKGAHYYTTAGHATTILPCTHAGPEQGWSQAGEPRS